MSYQWFRMWAEAVDDEKLRLLAFEDRWHFVALLCLKRIGLLDEPQSDLRTQKICVKLGLDTRELETVTKRLVTVGLITDSLQPVAWKKRQFESDSSTSRVRAFRKRHRNGKETFQKRPQTTDSETDTEKIGQTPSAFDRFWVVYPKKVKRKTAEEIWRRKHLDPRVDALMSDVLRRLSADKRWLEGYVPDPTTYLNQERWNDELQQPKPEASRGLQFAN